MVVLAGLDIVGSLVAKQYATTHRLAPLLVGAGTFVVLFVVYALSLEVAEMSIVTLGWIVLLQVGLLLLDVRGGLRMQTRQWVAVVLVIGLQCYLVASTTGAADEPLTRGGTGAGSRVGSAGGDAPPARPDPPAAPVVLPRSRPDAARPAASSEPATPYLQLDLEVVAQRYDDVAHALPAVALHYAVKANPAPEVLRVLAERGACFDVASPGEIEECLRVGVAPERLSYGNTVKKERDIAGAYGRGVRLFTFDSDAELAKLVRAAPGATLCCRLTTSGAGADWALSHKFGCGPDEALALLGAAAAAGHPVGVAFHVGSQQRDPGQWDEPLRATGLLQAQLVARGVPLAVVNIGGGLPASYRVPAPPTADYGAAITAAVRRHLSAPLPRLIAEPGRSLVADAGVIETEVVLVAERGGRRWVYLDVGLFGGLAETLEEAIQYRIHTSRDGGPTGRVVLAGPTCDSADVLYREAGYELPVALTAGDRVQLLSTGAYTASYSSVGFNGLPPLAVHCSAPVPAAV